MLLDSNGEPRVTDFGLAKRIEGDSALTATGQILGTPSYMPPEQASPKLAATEPATDIYSLGAILYAGITGRPPFQAESPVDTLMLVLDADPVSPTKLNPGIPRDLATISLKCLEKQPGARYTSAAELSDELQRFLNHEPIRARPLGPIGRTVRWCRRKPTLAAALATAIALVAALGLVAWRAAVSSDRERERHLYLARMQLASHAWQESDLQRFQGLVDTYLPENNEAYR